MMEIVAYESIGDIIFSVMGILLLPLGIYILFNTERTLDKYFDFIDRTRGTTSTYVFGKNIDSRDYPRYNRFVFKAIGCVATLMGLLLLMHLVMNLAIIINT